MRRIKLFIAVTLIAGLSLVQTGCIGSFSLTKKVFEFNRDFDNIYVQEALFIGMLIIPVYEVSTLVDALILNLIEFWTGDNPIAHVNRRNELIDVTKGSNSLTFNNKNTNEQLKIFFDNQSNTVYAEVNDELIKLIEYLPDTGEALIFLPHGESQVIYLSN